MWVTKWECGYEAKILAMKNFCISISIKITWPLEHISDLSLSYSSSSFCLFMKDTCCNCFQSGCFPLLSKGNSFWRTLACVTKSTNSEIAFKLAIKCELSFNSFLFVIYGTSLLSQPWDVERIKEKKYIGKAINAGGKRTVEMLVYRPWQITTVAQANSNVFFPRIHGQKSEIKVSADSNMSLESATESISCCSPGQQPLTSLGLETHCSNVCIYLQIILFFHLYLFYSVLQGHLPLHLNFIWMIQDDVTSRSSFNDSCNHPLIK